MKKDVSVAELADRIRMQGDDLTPTQRKILELDAELNQSEPLMNRVRISPPLESGEEEYEIQRPRSRRPRPVYRARTEAALQREQGIRAARRTFGPLALAIFLIVLTLTLTCGALNSTSIQTRKAKAKAEREAQKAFQEAYQKELDELERKKLMNENERIKSLNEDLLRERQAQPKINPQSDYDSFRDDLEEFNREQIQQLHRRETPPTIRASPKRLNGVIEKLKDTPLIEN